MKQPLKGPHHFTGITRDVTTNVDFWCRVMGMRFVKNTLNFETTFRYHTYFGDEEGDPGSVVPSWSSTRPSPRPRRRRHPADGPARRLLRLARVLDGPADRQPDALRDVAPRSDPAAVARLSRPRAPRGRADGVRRPGTPLVAGADDIPAEHRILGLEGARSFTTLQEQLPFAEHVGFRADGTRLVLDGERSGRWYFSEPPGLPSGDGRVGVSHHIAFDAGTGEEAQRAREEANEGVRPWTKIFDHYFFDSCYSMSPEERVQISRHEKRISTRREARRPRRPTLSLASSGAASRQARIRADADHQPAPALEGQDVRRAALEQRQAC